jgi:hypothetical protein
MIGYLPLDIALFAMFFWVAFIATTALCMAVGRGREDRYFGPEEYEKAKTEWLKHINRKDWLNGKNLRNACRHALHGPLMFVDANDRDRHRLENYAILSLAFWDETLEERTADMIRYQTRTLHPHRGIEV